MLIAVKIFIILLLLLVSYQDFRYRAVTWILFPLLAASIAFNGISENSFKNLLSGFAVNFSFITFQLIILFLYFSYKNKKWVLSPGNYIGSGDIILFYILGTFFSPVNFIIFMTVCLLSILIIYGIIKLLNRFEGTIPLAGAMSVVIVLLLGWKAFYPDVDFYNDDWLINYLSNIYV